MTARVEFQPRDLWVGVFWKLTDDPVTYPVDRYGLRLKKVLAERTRVDVWVCLIPCLPFHLTFHVRGSVVCE